MVTGGSPGAEKAPGSVFPIVCYRSIFMCRSKPGHKHVTANCNFDRWTQGVKPFSGGGHLQLATETMRRDASGGP